MLALTLGRRSCSANHLLVGRRGVAHATLWRVSCTAESTRHRWWHLCRVDGAEQRSDTAFGAALPAAVFVRALCSGDDEMAMKLGVLSLLEEDVALADYVLGGEAQLKDLLRAMLARIRTEFTA